MGFLIALGLVVANTSSTGPELIQQCREQREKVYASSGDREFSNNIYIKCLNGE